MGGQDVVDDEAPAVPGVDEAVQLHEQHRRRVGRGAVVEAEERSVGAIGFLGSAGWDGQVNGAVP